jgi:deoxyribodipyrimidine photolyase-related protein
VTREVRLVLPHQLFHQHLDAPHGTTFVPVEHDLQIDTDGRTTSRAALARAVRRLRPTRVTAYDVVDDWLAQDLTADLAEGGLD